MDIPSTITCVDCGEPAHLLGEEPEEGWSPGDYVAYRCSGCNDRWDMIVEEPGAIQSDSLHNEARAILEQRIRAAEEKGDSFDGRSPGS